jgi:hypothetical protein
LPGLYNLRTFSAVRSVRTTNEVTRKWGARARGEAAAGKHTRPQGFNGGKGSGVPSVGWEKRNLL